MVKEHCQIRDLLTLTTVSKVVNTQNTSISIGDPLKQRASHYNLRGDAILKLPKVNTTNYGLKSIRYQGARLWNALPNGTVNELL